MRIVQVAERLGIQLAAKPLEDGRYWLVWPQSNPDLLQQPSEPSSSTSATSTETTGQTSDGSCPESSANTSGTIAATTPPDETGEESKTEWASAPEDTTRPAAGTQGYVESQPLQVKDSSCTVTPEAHELNDARSGTQLQVVRGDTSVAHDHPAVPSTSNVSNAESRSSTGTDASVINNGLCKITEDSNVSQGSLSAIDNSSSSSSSSRLLIDPYGQGSFLTAEEVCELFELPPEQLSQPATKRELMACLLGDLRDAYWAKAAGCSPAPATMVPLSLQTALDPVKLPGGINIHAVDRALSAAEKITWLLPRDGNAQLQFALLHYFARNWDDAWIELGLFIERSMNVDTQACVSMTSSTDDVTDGISQTTTPSEVQSDVNDIISATCTVLVVEPLIMDSVDADAETDLHEPVHEPVQAYYDQTSAEDLRMARLVLEKIRLQLALRGDSQ